MGSRRYQQSATQEEAMRAPHKQVQNTVQLSSRYKTAVLVDEASKQRNTKNKTSKGARTSSTQPLK